MADIRDLRSKLHDAIRDWQLRYSYIEEHLIDLYEEDDEVMELVDIIMAIIEHHKGVK